MSNNVDYTIIFQLYFWLWILFHFINLKRNAHTISLQWMRERETRSRCKYSFIFIIRIDYYVLNIVYCYLLLYNPILSSMQIMMTKTLHVHSIIRETQIVMMCIFCEIKKHFCAISMYELKIILMVCWCTENSYFLRLIY